MVVGLTGVSDLYRNLPAALPHDPACLLRREAGYNAG